MRSHFRATTTVSSLASMPDGSRPPAESAARRRVVHVTAVSAVAVTAVYLTWRVGFTIDLSFWWVAIPLLALELHNAIGLVMFTAALWNVDHHPETTGAHDETTRIAVLVPTYDEPEEVLLPTVAAAVSLEPHHETWVLDDGRRPEVEQLARDLGARYLTRPDNRHAKGGNLNHALSVVEADIVAVLDADHIAQPDFLRATLPYFADPKVALVQTPQDFYNLDSFEHQPRGRRRIFNEQAIFYRVIAAGKNLWGGAFWCGTGALVRVAALRSVGGVATETVTEDIHTTIRLHRAGWKTVYHNEVLARGLAARSYDEYQLQRRRWATGAMQVLRRENPLTVPGLTFGQRLSYATTLWAWFDAWRSLGYILLPILALVTGGVAISAPLEVLAPAFLGTLALQFVAFRVLARGYYPPYLSVLFEFLRMPAILAGTLTLLGRRPEEFRVTPKGRREPEPARIRLPLLTVALLALTAVALFWFAFTLAGVTPFAYDNPAAMYGVSAFLVANAAMLYMASRRIRSPRFGAERRSGARLRVALWGMLDGQPCEIRDVSLTGARVRLPEAPETFRHRGVLRIAFPAGAVELAAVLHWHDARDPEGGVELGLAFAPEQRLQLARLALAVLAVSARASEPVAVPELDGEPAVPATQPETGQDRHAA
jgi:cellulose synthase (UDP-forming)